MTLSKDFHDSKDSDSIWQSVTRGDSLHAIVASMLSQLIPMLLSLVLATLSIYYYFGTLVVVIVVATSFVFSLSSYMFLSIKRDKRRRLISSSEREFKALRESTSCWTTASYFNRIPYEMTRFTEAVQKYLCASLEFRSWIWIENIVQSLILFSGVIAACVAVTYQVVRGTQSRARLVLLLSHWDQVVKTLKFFSNGMNNFSLSIVAQEKFLGLLRMEPSVSDQKGARNLELDAGEITFKNVSFSYDGNQNILDNVSFQAEAGKTTAIIGKTSGGKSTMFNLMFRFYDPQSGSISIDGQDIRNVKLESLRKHIAVVPQDFDLFDGTIMENIRYASAEEKTTDQDVFDACKDAALHDKVMQYTDKYNTQVGEHGAKLSPGERQRLVVARAILKNTKINLLDEPTSKVDKITEAEILLGLRKRTAGRTTIFIA